MSLKKRIRRVFQEIDGKRIPGLNAFGDGEWAYFLALPGVDPRAQFQTLVSDVTKRRAKSGAISEAGSRVTLPDGRTFHGVYYRGDVRGWRADLRESCQKQGIVLAHFRFRRFVINGEAPRRLKELKIEVIGGRENLGPR
ncbi:MAG TPA: hypothetical protein ENK63_00185 [Rhodobacterales bacterium]|nr:hypothetical protein [Rhodobacterales bacterium]